MDNYLLFYLSCFYCVWYFSLIVVVDSSTLFITLLLRRLSGVVIVMLERSVRAVIMVVTWCCKVDRIVQKWVKKWVRKTGKNGPGVWAFCKKTFSGIQKPV